MNSIPESETKTVNTKRIDPIQNNRSPNIQISIAGGHKILCFMSINAEELGWWATAGAEKSEEIRTSI